MAINGINTTHNNDNNSNNNNNNNENGNENEMGDNGIDENEGGHNDDDDNEIDSEIKPPDIQTLNITHGISSDVFSDTDIDKEATPETMISKTFLSDDA